MTSQHSYIWNDSTAREFDGLAGAETFVPVHQRVESIIDAKCLYDFKSEGLGHITKAKLRLEACGLGL